MHVRVRRDADEQLVLAHVWNKLAGLVQHLTVHIFKDDWMRRTTHQLVYSNQQHITSNYVPTSFNMPLPPPPPPPLNILNPGLLSSTKHVSGVEARNKMTSSTFDNDFVIVNP